MDINYCDGEDGYAYYAKGHVLIQEFMAQLAGEVDEHDAIRSETPFHTWKRFVRDFQEGRAALVDAEPESRGAFPVTWVESIS